MDNVSKGKNMARANVKVTFLCPMEEVWNTVTDLENYGWRSDIKKIRIVDDRNFEEYSKEGIVTFFQVTNKKECELSEKTADAVLYRSEEGTGLRRSKQGSDFLRK